MSQKAILFIEYGQGDRHFNQIKYCLMTLLYFNNFNKSEIFVYTEDPDKYSSLPVTAISIKDKIYKYSLSGTYHFRIKPCVIRDALMNLKCPILFLDTDTFINKNLSEIISGISTQSIFMNQFEKADPFPELKIEELELPSGKIYSYSKKSLMFNSGVLALNYDHLQIINDAIFLIDAIKKTGIKFHTIEQFAITEVFRLNNINIRSVISEVTHYTRGTGKDYMDDMIRKRIANISYLAPYPTRKFIKFNWFIPRLYKFLRKIKLGFLIIRS